MFPASLAPKEDIAEAPPQAAPQAPAVMADPGPVGDEAGPRKIMETPDFIVYDDFLPQEIYGKLHDFMSQTDFQYINTQGKVKRVWDISNGFPLRTDKNVFYYADPQKKPDTGWVYPSKTPFDMFIEHLNRMVPEVQHMVGKPHSGWEHYSVTGWLYPQNTGLSMHDDGSGVYSGAYVFFMNNEWRPHWGGLLVVLDHASNQSIQHRKKEGNAYKFHMQKWLHMSDHDEIAMDRGLGNVVFPKGNRLVFINPDAFHLVTQVTPAAGDHVRMSLAGFFHRGKKKDQKGQPKAAENY
jgi:hypothetical protein